MNIKFHFLIYYSNNLKTCINSKDEQKIVGLYMALCGEHNSTNCIIGRLETINAFHLKSYAIRTAVFWHELLKEKFSKYLYMIIIFYINYLYVK